MILSPESVISLPSRRKIVLFLFFYDNKMNVVDLKKEIKHISYPFLDGIRGIAALTIVLRHSGFPISGAVAVEIFFFLSSFLLSLRLLNDFALVFNLISDCQNIWKQLTGKILNYILKRIARIYPLYIVVLVVLTFLSIDHRYIFYSVAKDYYINFSSKLIDMVLLVDPLYMHNFWSLRVEFTFYFYLPFASLVASFLIERYKKYNPNLIILMMPIIIGYFYVINSILSVRTGGRGFRKENGILISSFYAHRWTFWLGFAFALTHDAIKKIKINISKKALFVSQGLSNFCFFWCVFFLCPHTKSYFESRTNTPRVIIVL